MDDLVFASATTLARAIRTGGVSSEEVVHAHLRRIEDVNPRLNAVVQVAPDALERARQADAALERGEEIGLLHGVPVTIKDSLDTVGLVSSGGTRGRATFLPAEDATVVQRLRAAGAIVLGKTNCPEFCMVWETDNDVYGRTSNPYDLTRVPGASSGGEAAIIAAGGSPLGIGSDSGGSIRYPAHCCGIAGLKPTAGRVPTTGHFPAAIGVTAPLWGIGPMARYVEDLALVLPLIARPDGRDPRAVPAPLGDPRAVELKQVRVAFYTDNGVRAPTPEMIAAVQRAARVLAEDGLAIEEARPAGIEAAFDLNMRILGADGGASVYALADEVGSGQPSALAARYVETVHPYAASAADLCATLEEWDRFNARMLRFLERYDVILCPAYPTAALPHGTTMDNANLDLGNYTELYNLTGWPAVVLRAGTSPEGLPLGVQVVAGPWQEHVALAIAQHLEPLLGGWRRPPL